MKIKMLSLILFLVFGVSNAINVFTVQDCRAYAEAATQAEMNNLGFIQATIAHINGERENTYGYYLGYCESANTNGYEALPPVFVN